MTYAGQRTILDADSHVMELPGFLDDFLESAQRDQTTVRYFATHVSRELGVGEREATLAVAILLGAIETVLAQWRRRPTRQYAIQLEDAYITLVTGGLAQLAVTSA